MKVEPKKPVNLSAATFFVLILAGTMGWYLVLTQLNTSPEGYQKDLVEIGKEILKVVLIAMAAAIAMDRVVRNANEDQRTTLSIAGIKNILPSRAAAAADFLKCVRDDRVRHITIAGISLRDFLNPGSGMGEVWREICGRMKREQDKRYPEHRRLHVRFLLLLPNSDEGFFRHDVESFKVGAAGGLPSDVPSAHEQVRLAQQEIFKSEATPYLMMRFYEHCPFSFVFATEAQVFVEQYDYRDQSQRPAMPLIVFSGGTNQYSEQLESLQVMWDHAHPPEVIDEVGTAAALRRSRIRNIYRREDRKRLAARQIDAIEATKEGPIDILVISGRFYTTTPGVAMVLQNICQPKKLASDADGPGVPIRFAAINPVSQQAIFRAVADSTSPKQVGNALRTWNWQQHQNSNLYRQTSDTMRRLHNWRKDKGCRIEVKVYSSAVACSILKTDNCLFTEQYLYGRSMAFQPGFDLGGEYALVEYDTSKNNRTNGAVVEHEIINATFDTVWNFFSISWDDYCARDEREQFCANLAALCVELGVPPSD